jgi:hypothetical protein
MDMMKDHERDSDGAKALNVRAKSIRIGARNALDDITAIALKCGVRFVIAPHIAHETVDGEVVILDAARGLYFSLTGAGSDVWALLAAPASVDAVAAALAARTDGPRAEIDRAVAALVDALAADELVVPAGLGPDLAPVALAPEPGAWVPPRLERFTDLQALLLLDPVHDDDEAGWPRAAKNG